MAKSFYDVIDLIEEECKSLTSDYDVSENDIEDKKQKKKRMLPKKHTTKKKHKKDNGKLPTPNELNNFGEMETLYHSSLFHMQTNELLKEVRVKLKWKKAMNDWLKRLKDFIFEIPASEKFELTDQEWTKKLKVPIIQDPFTVKGIFQFLPPSEMIPVGSYPLNLTCLPDAVVDVALEIPNNCWQHGDFLNHRYHRKRALYLTYLASCLREANFIEDIHFCYQHGNNLRPVLLLSPAGKLGKWLRVCILPHPQKDYFKLTRFSPLKNNVRSSWFFKDNNRMESNDECPTPHYNASVLIDITLVQHAKFLKESLLNSSSIEEGILLLKIWLRQRGLSQGFGGFSNFIVTMLVVYLLKMAKISTLISSYQVFRSTLVALCQDKILEKGISFIKNSEMKEFHQVFEVVFTDHSGSINFCSWITKKMLHRVQHEAKLSLEHMDSDLSNSFDNLFLKSVSFCQKFDHIMHIINYDNLQNTIDLLNVKNSILDHGGNVITALVSALESLISKALCDRILVLGKVLWHPGKWKITDCPPDPNDIEKISFGLLLNPEKYNKIVDRGPSADSSEAEIFRTFWGEKSELRRFTDGGICEAVVWPGKYFSDRQKIISNILKYILKIHAGIQDTMIHYVSDQLDIVLSPKNAFIPEECPSYKIGEEANLEAVSKFNELVKNLQELKNIPLSIVSVQGISPVLRYTEVFPPLSSNYKSSKKMTEVRGNSLILKENIGRAPQWVQPLEVLLTLERSGKWPDDIEAIHFMKTAFYLKLSEELYSQFYLTAAACRNYLDVLKDGYIFRIFISSRKELTRLKQKLTAEGMLKVQDTEESLKLENAIVHLPNLSSYIYGLYHQNNSYGHACRLAKRWVSSQMFSDYILEPCIELLMAYIYISPSPFSVPNSPQVAFIRFLSLLHKYDWKTTPLIVNFNNELKREECMEIHSNFTKQRTSLPVIVIATPFDRNGITWTRKTNPLIFNHLINIAKEAHKTLECQIFDIEKTDFKQIFRPPLDIYDITIHLRPCQVPRQYQAIDTTSTCYPAHETYKCNKEEKIPIVGFNPVVCYLKELKDRFDEIAFFFYDHFGGNAIYILWKPKAFQPRDSKTLHIKYKMMESNGKLIPDIEAITGDFAIIGTGLVKEIH